MKSMFMRFFLFLKALVRDILSRVGNLLRNKVDRIEKDEDDTK